MICNRIPFRLLVKPPSSSAPWRVRPFVGFYHEALICASIIVQLDSYCHFGICEERQNTERTIAIFSGHFLWLCDMSCLVPRFVELGLTLTLTMLVLGHMKNNGRPFNVKKFFKRSWRAYW